ncbi:hypothetical protein Q5752_006354 [Cryptotrichosporon argae]
MPTSPSSPQHGRTPRACDQCRRRKQRCDGLTVPCRRCLRTRKTCSFLLDGLPDADGPSNSASAILAVQEDVRQLRAELTARLQHLERLAGVVPPVPVARGRAASSSSTPEPSNSALDFSAPMVSHPPMQVLRGLWRRPPPALPAPEPQSSLDPVSRGVVTKDEAQYLFDVFFSGCHELAPCASKQTQLDAAAVRARSAFLFSAICLIGARYWEMDHPVRSTRDWLHPRYPAMVAILDEHMHNLTLLPTAADFTLEAVQALLLTIQWPALESANGRTSRFNDAYAWSMIGLAIRVARYIGLEDCGDDPSKVRVWINLVSVDRLLALMAGLPSSLSPPSPAVVEAFRVHPDAQTGDIKLAGLAELIAIVQHASDACGDVSLRRLDDASLAAANAAFAAWDQRWSAFMRGLTPDTSYRQQMPFTALRWYRLAVNAIPVGRALGDAPRSTVVQTPAAMPDAVDAAFQLLWQYTSDAVSERPEREAPNDGSQYTMNFTALSMFMFAVDAYWITHAYAAVFLVLMYDRGCIDASLQVRPFTLGTTPTFAAPATPLYRIVYFAASIFDGICQGAAYHPAMRYRTVVANALRTLEQYPRADEAAAVDASANIDDMLNALLGAEQDWTFLRDFIVPT